MKSFLLTLILPLLAACTSLHGVTYTPVPHSYHAVTRNIQLRSLPDTTNLNGPKLNPDSDIFEVGQTGIWSIVRFQGKRYFVRTKGLGQYSWAVYENEDGPYYGAYNATGDGRALYTGPRGGQYYINGNGNKTYITPESTILTHPVQTGPRGGQYYINDNGRKTYIKR